MSPPGIPPACLSKNITIRRACLNACTIETCPLILSYWGYIPSLAANSSFATLFGISLILFAVQAFFSRRFIGFSVAMICGSTLEVIGYVGRIISHRNPFSENAFLIEIVCLTIAPAFYAAGLYFCLSRIVLTFGAENSRLAPNLYPQIFIPCDVLSLVLQALGGGIASATTHLGKNPAVGNHIMLAGLSFQVFTLAIFIALSVDFAMRTLRRVSAMGRNGAFDSAHAKLRSSFRFRGFLVALMFATLCIFTRSVYRVAELSEGWSGHLIATQKYFIGLEGAIVIAGILALDIFHPAFCFSEVSVNVEGNRTNETTKTGKNHNETSNGMSEGGMGLKNVGSLQNIVPV